MTTANNIKSYGVVFFDLDGTLIDSEECITKSVQFALNQLSIDETDPDILRSFIGPPLRDSFRHQYSLTDKQINQARIDFKQYFMDYGIQKNYVYPGILDLLWILRASETFLVVATTKPKDLAEEVLKHLDLLPFFKHVIGGTETGIKSTKSGIIEESIRLLPNGLDTNVVMVGDYTGDVTGAKANGIDSIAVTYGFGKEKELLNANPTYMASSVEDLRNILIGL